MQHARKLLAFTLATAISASPSLAAFAEDAKPEEPPKIALDAVIARTDGVDLLLSNRPDDVANLKIYDGTDLVKVAASYLPDGIVRLTGMEKSWTKFNVERMGLNASGTTVTESRSSQVAFAKPETTYLKPNVRREIQRDVPVYVIPVQWGKSFASLSFSGTEKNDGILRTKYSVSIGSGPELALVSPGSSEAFLPGTAYALPSGIVLHEKSLPEPENRVTLKADSVPLNYVTVRKYGDIIGEMVDVNASSDQGNDRINVRFRNVGAIKNPDLVELRVNDKIVEFSGVGNSSSTGSAVLTGFGTTGPITLSIHPSILGTKETVARIRVKDKNSMLYDMVSVDLGKFMVPNVATIETVPGEAATAFKIGIDPITLAGDYEKLVFTINGTDYSARGVKVSKKDASGGVMKDMFGNELYEFQDKVEFRKTGGGIELSFPTDKLKKTGNVFKLRNGNSELSSAEVGFDLGKTAYPAKIVPTNDEAVKFVAGTSETQTVDPVARPSRDVNMGTFNLTGLKLDAEYRFTARAFVKAPFNPFAYAVAGNMDVHAYSKDDGVEYVFSDEGLGGKIQNSATFSVRLSDFLAMGKTTEIEWQSADLERADGDGWRKIASAAGTKGSFSHKVEWNGCTDASGESCGKNGLPAKPTSIFEFAFGKPIETVIPAPKPGEPPRTPTDTTST